ncbi:hypothetical protein DPMN_129180 [Dreissena polymorpha]|uniref:Uncharacterized protein n=1 Tax=Dreissena polymorpha TaxID=45954 RepID=A0A9D4H475_DREPO|nr:hypothetical protein DPMN_129180 [Dreissena polymorpha]
MYKYRSPDVHVACTCELLSQHAAVSLRSYRSLAVPFWSLTNTSLAGTLPLKLITLYNIENGHLEIA